MFKAFTHKELLETCRNYRLFIILLVFITFGFSNPIFAKLTPELLKTTGFEISIPEPTAIDSWVQFYKNITTLLVLYIILFSSSLPAEINGNSLINLVTKGLPRPIVILSKFTVISIIWLGSYYICFAITYFYTPLLLEGTLSNILIASIFPAIFGILMISLSLFGAVITKHTIGAILIPLITYIGMSLLSIVDAANQYIPSLLISALTIISGENTVDFFIPATIESILLTIILLIITINIFNRQQL